jgi:U3 small nucleolar ribonucleoprotein protein LCP5
MIMAVADSPVSALLSALTESLISATSSLPSDHNLLLPPADGISLLDTKNALLLSYIQNLVFLIILKLRQTSESSQNAGTDLSAAAVKKLVELRVYMERGVRPLEGRLKYQIEKVLHAAEDAERAAATKANGHIKNGKTAMSNRDDGDDTDLSDADSEASPPLVKPSDLSYRPNPAALLRKSDPSRSVKSSQSRPSTAYKPPRITPTAMHQSNPPGSRDRRQRKSHLLDEYVSSELSSAPLAEPSIGSNSTILDRGRGSLNARQREKERERTEYEERNLARLPGESKAEKRKARARGEGGGRNVYGGEQWLELGEVGDRVSRSVGRNRESNGGRGVLERREKRRRDNGDERGGGVGIGEAFEKRRRVMEGRAEKKTRRGR